MSVFFFYSECVFLFGKRAFLRATPIWIFQYVLPRTASAIYLWQSAFQNRLSYGIVCMTSWTSLNETRCWAISLLIIFLCRKVELSLSWKLTFVLIKASMLVPDQFNWQVWCLRFVRSLYRPLCNDLPLWFDVLVSKSRWSAPAANDLARCQKLLFLSHYFTVLCGQLMTILSLYYFLCCLFESKHVFCLFVRDNRAVIVMFLSFSLGKHEIQPDLWFLSYRCDSNIWFFFFWRKVEALTYLSFCRCLTWGLLKSTWRKRT